MAIEYLTEKDGEKMREAVKALEQESTEFEEIDFMQEHKKIPVTLDLTPCEDAISRQEAVEAFQMFREYESNRSNKEWVNRIETVLNQLPSVNPQPKTGHWIHQCSECGYIHTSFEIGKCDADYCPKCGGNKFYDRLYN